MPNYKYRVVFEDGKLGRGKIFAQSRAQAIEMLKKNNIQPISVEKMRDAKQKKFKRLDYAKLAKNKSKIEIDKKKKKDLGFKAIKIENNSITFPKLSTLFSRIKTKDVITFSNNFYILKKAKFTNSQALQSIYDGLENQAFKDIIEDILIGVEAGEKIYAVMANYPQAFPPMYVNFVKVGEESGTLDTALLHARDYIESSTELKKRVKGAIIPRVLQFLGIMIAMFAALILGVPILENVYDMFDSDQEIPIATQIGLAVAKWCVANWYILVRSIGNCSCTFLYVL